MLENTSTENLNKLLYRIILGYYYIFINNQKYKIVYPNINIKYEAEILYDSVIEENKYDKAWLTDKEIEFQLGVLGLWGKDKEKTLKDLETGLEDTKIELYLNFTNQDKKKKHKKEIQNIIKKIAELLNQKNIFNHLSIKEYAFSIKNEFIIMNTIYNSNNRLHFRNPQKNTHKYKELQLFIKEILDNSVHPTHIRELAKSDIWRSYTAATVLEKNIADINDDYKNLINIHKMYDSAKQHPEAPSDDIFKDDDALDGWFIFQGRKSEKEKKKNAIMDRIGGNIKNAGEVFLMTDDKQEAKDIYSLNDAETNNNIQEIKRLQKEKGSVEWQDLPFVKRQVQQKMQAESKNIIRKKS
jgi:hypothetical protein